MKKIYSLLFTLVMLSAFTACTNEVDDVFDKSSAERIATAINDDTKLLTSAANGWVMKYYADTQYGGYNVYCKFNTDGTVNVSNELYGDSVFTSHYSVAQSQGVLLSFDTYNELIHIFSTPDASVSGIGDYGKGMLGDFEFRIQSACADSIVMKGKKHGSKVVMTPMASGATWSDYNAKVQGINDAVLAYNSYYLIVGNDTMSVSAKYRQMSFVDEESGNTINMPFIFTETGIQLYKPVTYKGKTITGFTYSEDDKWLDPADNSVMLCPVVPPLSTQFMNGEWFFANSGMNGNKYWAAWIAQVYPKFKSSFGGINILLFTPNGKNMALYWTFGKYSAYINYAVTVVSDNQITFTNTNTGDTPGNGLYLYNNYYFNYITMPFEDKTFTITSDNDKAPTKLTLTDDSDPSNVIVLYMDEVANPLEN